VLCREAKLCKQWWCSQGFMYGNGYSYYYNRHTYTYGYCYVHTHTCATAKLQRQRTISACPLLHALSYMHHARPYHASQQHSTTRAAAQPHLHASTTMQAPATDAAHLHHRCCNAQHYRTSLRGRPSSMALGLPPATQLSPCF
jgi:hypothetical protein